MPIEFKPHETFRGDFLFANSEAAILRFPFPFATDSYMYSVNIEPHDGGGASDVFRHPIDIDEHYVAECRDRAITLERDPGRYAALPHMMLAQWDALEFFMEALAAGYPAHFQLVKHGDDIGARWRWTNRALGIDTDFVFGDAATLPCEPLEYITRQVQGDVALLDHRDNNLYMDAGMITAQADWSLQFDIGMSFMEWHAPVPLAHQAGIFERALKFLNGLRQGQPMRRLNWTMTVNPRLDTAPETYPEWGADRATVSADNAGRLVHLRVELQTLFRLPRSNAILFPIRCYLIPLDELVRVPKWGKRLHRVLASLPPELAEYKGLTRYLPATVRWLSRYDDGEVLPESTEPGIAALSPR